ncbi:DNA-processing protein DprA [Acidipropionibacterium timonense]|uniref:DNA-processing protein DprA n=1 Tax=Acidipropionibacterium timonense TaxID=2161818 RepID=UPI00102FD3DE|nr:DNA-processing protein DprA [Acidipropionibacterium timonense]
MTWDDDRRARAALGAVCVPGDPWLREALGRADAPEVWGRLRGGDGDGPRRRRAACLDLPALLARSEQVGVRFVVPGDDEWPAGLDDLVLVPETGGGPPVGLWVLGPADLAMACRRSVAVVGSRAASAYGQDVATNLGYDLARVRGEGGHDDVESPWCVVSGGAFGIDVAAHRGALAAGGVTVCVQAGGLDAPYPRGNAVVLEAMARSGALVSEVPVGTTPTRPAFLARNRLIAAMSQGTVLVEAGVRSGALNTTTWASSILRPVMAVPGPVTSSTSRGPHRLLRDGEAILVRDADDVRSVVGPLQPELPRDPGPTRPTDALSGALLMVHEVLPARGTMSVDEVAMRSGLRVPECLDLLECLDARGMAGRASDGTWSVTLAGRGAVR